MQRFTLASARAAADDDKTAGWVGEFLASPGSDNAVLAAGLAQKRHWWAGPLALELERLERLAGPEADVLVPVAPEEWERDVEEMHESLDDGWEPPPLLAEFSDDRLLLQDGNHRYETLLRAGERTAWVLIFFDDRTDRDAFLEEHAAS